MFKWLKRIKEKYKKQSEGTAKEETIARTSEDPIRKREEKIYVIGSNHSLATKCYDWTAPFGNLADCDRLIINLTSLTPEILKIIYQSDSKVLKTRREIFKLLESGGEIYCIMQPSCVKAEYNYEYSFNYNCWSPINFNILHEEGDTIIFAYEEERKEMFKEWIDNARDGQC